jgi:aminomethyltransferase
MGLDRLVDWDLPDEASISIRALRQIRDRGVDRRINGVEMDGEPFPGLNDVKWPIVEGGRPIGQVTSAIYSPRLERNIGFAWLPADRSKPGSTVQVESQWGPRTATVAEMPFIDPNKQIPVS